MTSPRDLKHELEIAHRDELQRIFQQGHAWQHAVGVFAGRRGRSWVYKHWPMTERSVQLDYSAMDVTPPRSFYLHPLAYQWRQP